MIISKTKAIHPLRNLRGFLPKNQELKNTKEKHHFTFSDSKFTYKVVYRAYRNKCDLDSYTGNTHYDGTSFEEHIDQYFFIVDNEPITNKQLWLKQMGELTSPFGFNYE